MTCDLVEELLHAKSWLMMEKRRSQHSKQGLSTSPKQTAIRAVGGSESTALPVHHR